MKSHCEELAMKVNSASQSLLLYHLQMTLKHFDDRCQSQVMIPQQQMFVVSGL